ncbi:MAG TPA: methyltransferase domain-containing protein [Chryseolinea sp.]|nr:methyltransferase domain-containing protein [Chryseolinea sp.]
MTKMPGGFDWIAPYYDSLARLVFGDSIRRCQIEYLDEIPPGSKVLILCGGTGWLLAEIMKANPTCTVWYVESSIKMLEIAKARFSDLSNAEILFIHGTEKNLQQYNDTYFDAVITNFYFDVFTSSSLDEAMTYIQKCVYPGSKLLVSDFVDRSWWQRFLLFLMYRFFRWTCAIEARNLPDWQRQLERAGFTQRSTTSFYGGFIKTSVHVFEEK